MTREREHARYTLSERLATARRTAVMEFQRDFAGAFIIVLIVPATYAVGMPSWAGVPVALIAARIGSAPLSRWLLAQIRRHRASRSRSS